MEDSRQNTVLFADVSGSTQLYQRPATGRRTADHGLLGVMPPGRGGGARAGVKTIGDEVMAAVPQRGRAWPRPPRCSRREACRRSPEASSETCASGCRRAVIQHGEDVFGDTVNSLAPGRAGDSRGQIIRPRRKRGSSSTRIPHVHAQALPRPGGRARPKASALCEVLWFASGSAPRSTVSRRGCAPSGLLRPTKYLGQEHDVRRRENEAVTLRARVWAGGPDGRRPLRLAAATARSSGGRIKWVLKDTQATAPSSRSRATLEIMLAARGDDAAPGAAGLRSASAREGGDVSSIPATTS